MKVDAIVLHCTATLAHQDFRRAEIEAMHRKRGFRTIGYHGLITLAGKLEAGRPLTQIGAHVLDFNDRTLGLVYVGGLRSTDAMPIDTRNPKQITTMRGTLVTWMNMFPKAVILGHRALSPDLDKDGKIEPHEWMKICPCFDAAEWAKSVGLPGGRYVHGKFLRI